MFQSRTSERIPSTCKKTTFENSMDNGEEARIKIIQSNDITHKLTRIASRNDICALLKATIKTDKRIERGETKNYIR